MPRVTPRSSGPLRVAAVALLLSLSGCSGGDSESRASDAMTTAPQSSAESTAPQPIDPWTLPLPVIGQPVAAGDVVAVYTTAAGMLSLVGVDARTGEHLWTHPASPADVVPGIPITPTVVHDGAGSDYLAYFRPQLETSLNARLVVADPRTGEDVAVTNGDGFTSPPRSCDDGVDVCFETGYTGEGKSIQRLRLSDGTVTTEPRSNGYIRTIGPLGLSDVRTNEDEYLARVENGAEMWRVALDEAFGRGYSTDGGWSWRHHEDAGLLVGSIGRALIGSLTSVQDIDLAASVTVALHTETGAVAWRDVGSVPDCFDTIALPEASTKDGVAVRCRYLGHLSIGAIAGPQEILLPTTDGPSVVDLLTGRSRPPEPTDVLACDSPVVAFDYDDPFYIDGTPITERHGEALTVACHPDRSPAQRPLPPPVLASVSISVEGAYVHATDSGLVGYPAG